MLLVSLLPFSNLLAAEGAIITALRVHATASAAEFFIYDNFPAIISDANDWIAIEARVNLSSVNAQNNVGGFEIRLSSQQGGVTTNPTLSLVFGKPFSSSKSVTAEFGGVGNTGEYIDIWDDGQYHVWRAEFQESPIGALRLYKDGVVVGLTVQAMTAATFESVGIQESRPTAGHLNIVSSWIDYIRVYENGAVVYSDTFSSAAGWTETLNTAYTWSAQDTYDASGSEGSLTNADYGTYVLPSGKVYSFSAVGNSTCSITMLMMRFNDGVHNIGVQYNNVTRKFSLVNGSEYVSLGTGTATSVKSGSTYQLTVTFPITFRATILDASNVAIQTRTQDSCSQDSGWVNQDTFDILNKGGETSILKSGAAGKKGRGGAGGADGTGGDVFDLYAENGGWVMVNQTWWKLQSYHAQFAIRLSEADTGEDQYWQDISHAGSPPTEKYSDKGNWQLKIAWYYYDTSTWVKGWWVWLQMQQGDQGSNDKWTLLNATWYRGETLIWNSTFRAFIEEEPRAQVRLWLDMWFNKANSSRLHGGRLTSYYYAMQQDAFMWWGTWSPDLRNATASLYYGNNRDNSNNIISAQRLELSRISFNLSRPATAAGQANFRVSTQDFQISEFKLAKGVMGGVDTPVFVDTKIPDLPPGEFLTPLYMAISRIGDAVWGGLAAAMALAWNSLATNFPWFTGFWEDIGTNVVYLASLTATIWTHLTSFLQFLVSIIGYVSTPITIVSAAWNRIVDIYNTIFAGADMGQIIAFFITVVFGLSLVEALMTGDFKFILTLTQVSWRIIEAILRWTYNFVSFIVNAVLTIIPG